MKKCRLSSVSGSVLEESEGESSETDTGFSSVSVFRDTMLHSLLTVTGQSTHGPTFIQGLGGENLYCIKVIYLQNLQ